jgi:hypothetical protein
MQGMGIQEKGAPRAGAPARGWLVVLIISGGVAPLRRNSRAPLGGLDWFGGGVEPYMPERQRL